MMCVSNDFPDALKNKYVHTYLDSIVQNTMSGWVFFPFVYSVRLKKSPWS